MSSISFDQTDTPLRHVAVLGAGAIGLHLGASWATSLSQAGIRLSFVGRARTFQGLRGSVLRLTGGPDTTLAESEANFGEDASGIAEADLIILAMKATALPRAIADIHAHAAPGTPLISLLNGVAPVRDLRAALPDHPVIAGMVPYNVVWRDTAHLHRSSAGDLALERADITAALATLVGQSGLTPELHDDITSVQYGKLLLNLINPINALAGIPLHQMLSQRRYRQIYAAALSEALRIYDAAGVSWQKVGPISPRLAVRLLAMPDAIFNPTLLRLQKIDRASMTSMASDLMSGRPTEIDVITGEVLRLAAVVGLPAPVNSTLAALVGMAEGKGTSPRISAEELAEQITV